MRSYGDPRALERRRLKSIKLFGKGLRPDEIARQLGVDRRTVHRWPVSYHNHVADGLAPVPVSGRPPKLISKDRARSSAIRAWQPAQNPRVLQLK